MALLILIMLGATLGWLATIINRVEDRAGVLTHAGIGVLGSVIAGLITNNGSIIGGLSILALIAGIVGASLVLAAYSFYRERVTAN